MDNKNDSYEELLRLLSNDSSKGVPFSKNDSEVKNNGEIYFANSGNQKSHSSSSQNTNSQGGISFSGNRGSTQRISQPQRTSEKQGATKPVRISQTGNSGSSRTSSDRSGATRSVRSPSSNGTNTANTASSTVSGTSAGRTVRRSTDAADGSKLNKKHSSADKTDRKRKSEKTADSKITDNTAAQQPGGKKKKKKKGKKISAFTIKLISCILVIVLLGFLIRIPIMSCVNDVLALDGTNVDHRVTLSESMNYKEVIDLLGEKNLISNPWFCKIVAKAMGFDSYTDSDGNEQEVVYPAGDYDLSTDMGIEGMLTLIESAGNEDSTVSITFPEGYTVDQIAEKLELNGVCSKSSFYAALATDKIYEKYDFLSGIDKTARYRAIEGYLYPDTYDFYVGEDPYSAIGRFLDNFEAKWTDDYAARAEKLGYSMDEILTVASILEKEAADSEQMPLIASIIYNRLNSPSLYPFINCDSTAKYIENAKDTINDDTAYNAYLLNYDTYQHNGLPVGPICNPGADAIYAALYPDSTKYYYFLHDKDGKIYVAKTAAEHAANGQYIDE